MHKRCKMSDQQSNQYSNQSSSSSSANNDQVIDTNGQPPLNSSNVITEPNAPMDCPSAAASSSNVSIMNQMAQSPPRFVNLEEIDRAANGVSNMFLSHQIAMDKNFRLQQHPAPEGSLRGQVLSALKQAFWDILQSQLNESPPNFKQALNLLSTIKQDLCGLLLNQQSKLKQEIDEILDLELIKQQAEHGALDFQRYAQYILSVMARLCAPVRDDQIRELTQSSDVITLFKGIMHLLELMKLDMANFTIAQMRPHIVQHSVDYERQKFNEFVEMQSRMGCDGLTNTKHWFKVTCEQFDEQFDNSTDSDRRTLIGRIINSAYVQLLKNASLLSVFPETLAVDQDLFVCLNKKLQTYILTGSCLLIIMAAVPPLQSNAEFKQRLKQHLILLLTNVGINEQKDADQLVGVADYLVNELQKASTGGGQPLVPDVDKVNALKQQIVDLSSNTNRVRTVVQRRILEFVEQTLSTNESIKVQIPTGLNVLQDELMELAGCLIKVVTFNRSVFEHRYASIVDQYLSK